MTPKQKAKELINKFGKSISKPQSGGYKFNIVKAKDCALIAVVEIINSVVITDLTTAETQFKYWQQVKEEIKNL